MRIWAILILLFSGFSGLAFQTDESITPDTPIRDSIGQRGEVHTYIYTADEAQQVTITVTTFNNDLDGTLAVLDANGVLIGSNDDFGDSSDPTLHITLPAAGNYQIIVAAFADASTGDYEILLTVDADLGNMPTPIPPIVTEDGSLTIGSLVRGNLELGEVDSYTLSIPTNDSVQIVMYSVQFDTYLATYDQNGRLLAEDDDSGGGTNAAISRLPLNAGQTVEIQAGSFRGDSAGEYILSVTVAPIAPESQPITYGETLSATLQSGSPAPYTFEGRQGEMITASVLAEFDSLLILYDENGIELARDDDSGGDLQALIQSFILPEDGFYTLEVKGYNAFVEGEFTLSLVAEDGSSTRETSGGDLALNTPQSGTLRAGEQAIYTFQGSEGQTVSLTATADFDSLIEVNNPDGMMIASDDDSGGGLNPALTITLQETGEYTVVLRSFDASASGSYEFIITGEGSENGAITPNAETSVIEFGQTVSGVLDEGEATLFTFTAAADDRITVRVVGEADSYLELLGVDGLLFASDDDSGGQLNPLISDVTLPEDGVYTLVLRGFGQQAVGEFTLTLTNAAEEPTPLETPSSSTELTPPSAAIAVTVDEAIITTLEEGKTTVISFEGHAGQRISFTVAPLERDSRLDLYTEFFAPDGTLIASDDDSGWRLTPAVVDVELPEEGLYSFHVREFSGTGTGEFRVAVVEDAAYLSPQGDIGQATEFSEGVLSLPVTLDADESELYVFTLGSENTLILEDAPNGLDVDIYSADNFTETPLSTIVPLELAGEATYQLLLYAGSAVDGTVTLRLQDAQNQAAPSDAPREVVVTVQEALELNAPIQDTLLRGEVHQYEFTALLAGDYIFTLNSNDLASPYDPYLTIVDSSGAVLGEDDDSAGLFDAQIQLTLEADQVVVVQARGFSDQSGGDYLLVALSLAPETFEPLEGGALTVGGNHTHTLVGAGQQAEFTFTVAEDATYTFTIEGLKLPFVDVYDADGALVGRGAGVLYDQKLTAGDYNVIIFDRLNTTGEFTLSITESD